MLRINSPCAIDRFHIRGCSTIFQAVSGKIVAVEGAEPQNGKLRQINCPNTNNLYAAILELLTRFERATCSLRVSCSTCWATVAYFLNRPSIASLPFWVKRNLKNKPNGSKKLWKTAIFLLTKRIAYVIVVVVGFGRVPEWPKGTDCKSAAFSFGGSNPPSPTKNRLAFASLFFIHCESNGISSRVSVYIIKGGVAALVSHHTFRCVSKASFAMMIYTALPIFFATQYH